MKVKVRVFAGLKDYFPSIQEMEVESPTILSIKNSLLALQPESSTLLHLCRFAAGTEFVDENYEFGMDEIISFLPPSSGG